MWIAEEHARCRREKPLVGSWRKEYGNILSAEKESSIKSTMLGKSSFCLVAMAYRRTFRITKSL